MLRTLNQWMRNASTLCAILSVAVFVAGDAVAEEHRVDSGQVINSQFMISMDPTDTVRVNPGGIFMNGIADLENREIASVHVDGGQAYNETGSTVTYQVELQDGLFTNQAGATVGYFDMSLGEFANNGAVKGNGTVYGGTLMNSATGSLSMLTQNAGTVHNFGTVGFGTMTGGHIDNGGIIDQLRYSGGTYTGVIQESVGKIGTLALTDTLTGVTDWGIVDNLYFDNGGGHLTMFASGDNTNLSFGGIDVQDTASLYGGNVMFDLSGLGKFGGDWETAFTDYIGESLSFASLLGMDEEGISNGTALNSFGLSWGDEETFYILNDGQFANEDWSYGTDFAGIVYSGEGNGVPEPATLVILGLGLAGLGFARRRK